MGDRDERECHEEKHTIRPPSVRPVRLTVRSQMGKHGKRSQPIPAGGRRAGEDGGEA